MRTRALTPWGSLPKYDWKNWRDRRLLKKKYPGVFFIVKDDETGFYIHDSARIMPGAFIYSDAKIFGATLIAPGAQIRERAVIQEGVKIGAKCNIEWEANIGQYTNIQGLTMVAEKTEIGRNCFLAVQIGMTTDKYMDSGFSGVKIGNRVKIGAGVTILPGATIGDDAIIGAGCVIDGTIPQFAKVYAKPCKGIVVSKPEPGQVSNTLVGLTGRMPG